MRRAGNLNDVRDTEMKSIADLYQGYYASVYSTALRITGNPADAEDALQTVFLRVLNHEWQNSAYPPEAYFRRAAANAALDLLRREDPQRDALEEASAEYSAEDAALLKERLRRALASLEVDDAAMFSLRYIEGMSNGEIADLYRQEKNNVAVRLHRIRQTLKEKMER